MDRIDYIQKYDDVHIMYINEEIHDELFDLMDDVLVEVCEGNIDVDLSRIKRRFDNFFEPKSTSQKIGIISEFFIHLLMKKNDYKQEFLFKNLEEKSMKKGFDGVYSKYEKIWLMESKFGLKTIHKKKIQEANNDFKNTVSKNNKSNPYENAYNHASQIDVGSDETIRIFMNKKREEFEDGLYTKLNKINVILGSTSFVESQTEFINNKDLFNDIDKYLQRQLKIEYGDVMLVLSSINSMKLFKRYLLGAAKCGSK